MALERAYRSGNRLEDDLRLIREARCLTIDDVSRITKIPPDILQSFEESGLRNHPRFNEVYLRSFVKAYADALNVSVKLTLEALEASIKGRYTGALGQKYLEFAGEDKPADPGEKGLHPTNGASRVEIRKDSANQVSSGSAAAGEETPKEGGASPSAVKPPAGVEVHAAVSERPGTSPVLLWVGGAAAVAAGVLLIWLIYIFFLSPPSTDEGDRPGAREQRNAGAGLVVGDSLGLVLRAGERPVIGGRMRLDGGASLPLELDTGGMVRIQIRDRLDLSGIFTGLDLWVEGHRWPIRSDSVYQQVVITREQVSAFLDSLWSRSPGT